MVFGPSTWQVSTSTPWSIRLLVASASLTGIDQSPVKITCVVAFGLASLAPREKAGILRSTCGIGLAAGGGVRPGLLVQSAERPAAYLAPWLKPEYTAGCL